MPFIIARAKNCYYSNDKGINDINEFFVCHCLLLLFITLKYIDRALSFVAAKVYKK